MKFRLSQQNIGRFFRNDDISLKFRLGIIPIKEQEVACSFRLNKLFQTKKGQLIIKHFKEIKIAKITRLLSIVRLANKQDDKILYLL